MANQWHIGPRSSPLVDASGCRYYGLHRPPQPYLRNSEYPTRAPLAYFLEEFAPQCACGLFFAPSPDG
eukprot:7693629-Ditylum_brightwellii.AAC.1